MEVLKNIIGGIMTRLETIIETPRKDIELHINRLLPSLTFYRARAISTYLLTILYDLPYSNYLYDQIKNNWTKKISKILKEWEREGKLVIYNTSNRGNLYKKVK